MPPLLLTAEEVRWRLQEVELPWRRRGALSSCAKDVLRYGAFVGSAVECHARLDRAMDRGRRHIDLCEAAGRSVANGHLILAESLTGSKGRFTRSWHAPPGGLWGCLIHANTLTMPSALLLSLAVGIAACEAIREQGIEGAAIRWVNDVLVGGGKAAGFLIESHTGPRWGEVFHLIGFGINVANGDFPAELADSAISLEQAAGRPIDLKTFALSFIGKLAWNVGLLYFVEANRPEWLEAPDGCRHPVITRWLELSDSVGKRVRFGYDVMEAPQYQAMVTGIAPDGGLQLLLDDGHAITEHSGEIRYL